MPYIISNFDQSTNHVIEDRKINTELSSIPVIGTYTTDYSPIIAESFLWLTEKFCSTPVDVYNKNTGDLVVKASGSPKNPINGQLWYDYHYGDLMVYANGSWKSTTKDIKTKIESHINDKNNPHKIDKTSVGLSNVNNVPAFDKTLDFSEFQRFLMTYGGIPSSVPNPNYDPGLSLTIAQNTLNVYDKSVTYNVSDSDATFLNVTDTADDSFLFDKKHNYEYVYIDNPIVHNGFDANDVMIGYTLTPSSKTSIANTINNKYGLLNGVDYAGIELDNKLVAYLLNTSSAAPSLDITIKQANIVALNETVFGGSNISLNGNFVFHKGRIPTNNDLNTLDKNGTSVDSVQLNLSKESTNSVNNTIVKRSITGVITSNKFISTSTANAVSNISSRCIMLDKSSSESPSYSTKDDLLDWIEYPDYAVVGARAWASFNSKGGGKFYNCTLVKYSTSHYGITLNTTPASFTTIVTPVDNGQTPGGSSSEKAFAAGAVSIKKVGLNQIELHPKIYEGRYIFGAAAGDTDYVHNEWRSRIWDAPRYTVAFYY